MVPIGLTIYMLIHQNLFHIITNQIPVRYRNFTPELTHLSKDQKCNKTILTQKEVSFFSIEFREL